MKVTIFNGDGSYNRGDRAILAGLIELIRGALGNVRIYVHSCQPEIDAKWYGVNALDRGPAGLFDRWRALRESDIVIWGGGVLLQDNHCLLKIPYWVSRLFVARYLFGKRVIGFGQGVEPLMTKWGQFWARVALVPVDVFYSRERNSSELLARLSVPARKLRPLYDPALALPTASPESGRAILDAECPGWDKFGPVVGVAPRRWFNVRRRILPRKYTYRSARERELGGDRMERLEANLAMVLERVVRERDASIVFFPMYAIPSEGDQHVAESIRKNMNRSVRERAFLIKGDYSPYDYAAAIGNVDAMVGVRLHSAVLATLMGVPSITLAYSQKSASYFQQIGQERFVFSIDELLDEQSVSRITSAIAELLDHREPLADHIRAAISQMQADLRSGMAQAIADVTVRTRVRPVR